MPSIVKTLRAAADPNRLRILLLLQAEELSVAELQEILAMGQSTISTHLSQLKQAGLVEDRRTGKSSLYRLAIGNTEALKGHEFSRASQPEDAEVLKGHDFSRADQVEGVEVLKGHDFSRAAEANKRIGALAPEGSSSDQSETLDLKRHDLSRTANGPSKKNGALAPEAPNGNRLLSELLAHAAREIPEAPRDLAEMRRVVKKRQDKMRAFFDSVAGRLGKDYVPGKSWKSLAEALLRLMPPLHIADLGTGEGSFALLLSQRAERVIAVDTSEKMLEVGRENALRAGIKNIEFRAGDMEELPIDDSAVDLVFFSQSLHHALHPGRALGEACRILKPGGRVAVLDLLQHRFEEARDLYADEWLGFSPTELESLLEKAGFTSIQTTAVDKEPDAPHFQTLLAVADKPLN
jgi:ArsR family transcriptional regulator